jgi:hypothetical protein
VLALALQQQHQQQQQQQRSLGKRPAVVLQRLHLYGHGGLGPRGEDSTQGLDTAVDVEMEEHFIALLTRDHARPRH